MTVMEKLPLAPVPVRGALQDVVLPVRVAAVTNPMATPTGDTETTRAVDSGLVDDTESTGEAAAFAGFGATVGVSTGMLKSKTTDVLAWEMFCASSDAVSAITLVPDPSLPVTV